MPTVPVYTARTVSPLQAPNAFQAPRTTPADFGATGAASLGRVGAQAEAWANRGAASELEQKREDDATRVMDVYAKAADETRPILHDPKNGIFARQGSAAMGAYEEAQKSLDDLGKKYLDTLQNDDQKRAFTRLWNSRRDSALDQVSRHVAEQRKAYMTDTAKAVAKSAIEDAAENYNDPAKVGEALGRGESALRALGERAGSSPDVIDAEIAAFRSDTAIGVLNRMLAQGDYQGARNFYAANKEMVTGTKRDDVEKALREGTLRGEAQAQEDRIMGTGKGRADALAEARRITNPELRDETVKRINARFDESERIRTEAERNAKRSAWQKIEQTGSMDSLTPFEKASLDGTTIAAMERRADQIRRGKEPDPNRPLWYKLAKMSQEEPDKFAALDLNEYRGQLAHEEWDDLAKKQVTLLGRDQREAEKATSIKSAYTLADKRLRAAGIDPTPKEGTTAAEKLGEFHYALEQRIGSFERENKRRPKDAEILDMIDGLLVEGKLRGGGFFGDSRKRAYQVKPDEVANFYVPYDDIPAQDRIQVTKWLTEKGRPVTNEAVESLYAAYKSGNRAAAARILNGGR